VSGPATRPADERHHQPGAEALWNESWYFDFAAPDGSIGGYVRIGLYPNLGTVWYWACLVGPGRPLVMVVDHEVAPPPGGSLEVRSSGLWADHNCETPLEHWSLGLEAFALALDAPSDAYGSMRGDRVPFGFDLEWETQGEVFRYPSGLDRYEVPCHVHGEVLIGQERLEIDGVGQRDHSWGVRDWWAEGWCWSAFRSEDGTAWHAVVPDVSPFTIGYVQEPAGPAPHDVGSGRVDVRSVFDCHVRAELGAAGIPRIAQLAIGGARFAVEPIAWAPVLLRAPDGRRSRFPRGLARFRADRPGRSGVGWIEFNQPGPPDRDRPAPTVL
jgi:hypothetical protein